MIYYSLDCVDSMAGRLSLVIMHSRSSVFIVFLTQLANFVKVTY